MYSFYTLNIIITIISLTYVQAFQLHRRQTDPCTTPCANVFAAANSCPTSPPSAEASCLCPPVLASGIACSSCLASVDLDATDAAALGTINRKCQAAAAGAPTTPLAGAIVWIPPTFRKSSQKATVSSTPVATQS